tara:strand:- start:3097 stop:3786 length:690 start_codon:yes stop_codon:yes gene_type:complete
MISPLKIAVTKEQIIAAIEQAKEQLFIDNLRDRTINVALDSKIRGYIGEIALKTWFYKNGITFSTTNQLNRKSNMDVDFLYQGKTKSYEIELKTSLIPDQDRTIEEAICQRDIKLIRRGNDSIERLKSDVHIQLFFKQRRAAKDVWLESQLPIKANFSAEEIYHKLACFRYLTDTYLIGWIDKPTLIQQIDNKLSHRKTWKYGQREFWTCSLKDEVKPIETLISFLKEA